MEIEIWIVFIIVVVFATKITKILQHARILEMSLTVKMQRRVRRFGMGRLTVRDNQDYWTLKGVPWKSLCEGQVITKDVQERITGALCKLKDYEDFGGQK